MALLLTILKQFGFSQSRSCIRSFPLQNELSQSHLGGFKQSPHILSFILLPEDSK